MPSGTLNRKFWVTEVRRSTVSGELQLRLTDLSCAVAYCSPSEVVRMSADAQCTPHGPSVLDYRVFSKAQKKALADKCCASLGRDVQLATRGQLIEQTTLAWALQELQLRLPCSGVIFLTAAEVRSIETKAIPVVFLWFSCGCPMVFLWLSCVFLWFSCAFLWCSFVFRWFPVVFLWLHEGDEIP